MLKRLLFLFVVLFASQSVFADETRFVMSAPNAVSAGDQFRLSFSLNTSGGTNLRLPDLSNFEVLMGPSTSQSSSVQIINGRTTQSVEFSYTYILRAVKEGTFTIRPASIEVDGKIYQSNPLTIQVVKGRPQQQQQQGAASSGSEAGEAPSGNISKDDLFIRLELNKRNVYKGEQIIATVKLYANPNLPLSGFDEVSLPTYEGFYTQDIDIPQQINFKREVFNDKIYQVGVLKKTILFPQQSGTITIKPFGLAVLVQQRVRARSFFDDFFNSFQTVKAKVTADPVTVSVKNLPPAPADFYGGVGNFNLSSEISEQEVTTNDAVTLTLTISGTGNIRLIQSPNMELPPDFEKYDPRATDNSRATEGGLSGTKTVEYLFQPRFEGSYTVPPISFSFFNPATGQYEKRTTPEYKLNVKKGTGAQNATVVSALRKQDVQLIGQDIRFIKQNNETLHLRGYTFFGSTGFWAVYIIGLAAFIVVFAIYRKKVKENADLALARNRKANRIARRHLKAAAGHLKAQQSESFYEAVLKAFWGYLSDKLSIPMAELKRETAVENLEKREVEPALIHEFLEVLDQCEFARFAPAGGNQAMQELYTKAESVISKMEKQIKR